MRKEGKQEAIQLLFYLVACKNRKKMLMGEVICENKRNFSFSSSRKKKLLKQFPFFPSFEKEIDEKNSFLLKQLAKEFCRYFYVRRPRITSQTTQRRSKKSINQLSHHIYSVNKAHLKKTIKGQSHVVIVLNTNILNSLL